jgi:hypothetical protein
VVHCVLLGAVSDLRLMVHAQVPAVLLSSGECFEFVELCARITPAEFVGVRAPPPCRKPLFGC